MLFKIRAEVSLLLETGAVAEALFSQQQFSASAAKRGFTPW
ncbi:hypothetical protein MRBBS_3387 [Marinobacter sp. BSs20148]|nr:hypothetical protein MRBBS_3387 [Marinobacter sp. BSs20148]